MNIYIATKFQNQNAFYEAEKLIEDSGHCVILDWPAIGFAETSENATICANAVRICDAMIVIDHPKLAGALVEMGMAIALDKPIYLIKSKEGTNCIFFKHPSVCGVKTVYDAVSLINHINE